MEGVYIFIWWYCIAYSLLVDVGREGQLDKNTIYLEEREREREGG